MSSPVRTQLLARSGNLPLQLTPSDRNRTPPVFPDVYADAPTQIVFDAPTTKVTEITDVAVPAAAE